jgi:TfoX/Sxy family transcriptional regulator of competence genes
MPYDETLAVKIRQLLSRQKNLAKRLSEKKMFGGVGFLLNGNICCGAWKEFLILRLGEDAARQVLGEEHARPFDITGKPMRGWAMVEPAGWRDAARLRRWVDWAVEFTSDLPAK